MKKLIMAMVATAIVSAMAIPAVAATEWNFGASLRYATFYNHVHYGKAGGPDLEKGGAVGLKNDGYLDWSTQGNSRLKFFMKSDKLQGYFELGYDFSKNTVTAREMWGKYNFGQGWSLTVGQAHQLFNTPGFSNQVWGGDLGMHSVGVSFNPPTPKIILSYSGFSFALSEQPHDKEIKFSNLSGYNADIDSFIPQVQVNYQYRADTWRLKIFGAFQTYKLKDLTGGVLVEAKDKNINSWLVGFDGDINFGPLYVKGTASVGQNWANAQWNSNRGGLGGPYSKDKSVGIYGFKLNDNGSVKNTTSWMAALVAGYRLTEALKFEGGAGYRSDDNETWHGTSHMWNFYLQAQYTVTPGFTITPEIGYIDLGKAITAKGSGKGSDLGYTWYAGAKWQFDF